MKNRIPLTKRVDHLLVRDTAFLLVASCFVLVRLFDYAFGDALLLSPLIVAGFMFSLYLMVQLSWLAMVLLDKLLVRLNIGDHSI